ncbi:hypothetical protein AMS68_007011 [Peltaster fructicola]|uniref:PSP proline-rich domain-containing protein n=1 Tax=Peltaster fructicola TaxID=286661 RepID=A0A6H0Y3A7_9PEZI|nr:hypothetical protein AMS68_007011 [Peltaster fructicola]
MIDPQPRYKSQLQMLETGFGDLWLANRKIQYDDMNKKQLREWNDQQHRQSENRLDKWLEGWDKFDYMSNYHKIHDATRPSAEVTQAPAVAVAAPRGAPNEDDFTIETLELSSDQRLYGEFKDILARFEDTGKASNVEEEAKKPEVFFDDEDNVQDEEEEEETQKKLTRKARKARDKLSIAELKSMAAKPDMVDWTDVTAADPKLLVNIKASRNVIQVPAHWGLKREYLSSKRGVEKGNFRLPTFIAETGISEMRPSEGKDEQSLKQQGRDRVKPSMGKLDIDYQKLFEAFFRRQTKPFLTGFGEVYYEGKEYEAEMKIMRPGETSDRLKDALGIPASYPDPWLLTQQKHGPPPSYPAIRLPGLNAPLPPGANWGFELGQWGRAPVKDDYAKTPLGWRLVRNRSIETRREEASATTKANLEEAEEYEDEEDEADEEDAGVQVGKEEDIGGTGLQTPFGGAATPSGIYTSTGMKSVAGEFDLRKQRQGNETEDPPPRRAAGQVLQERAIRNEGFFGGERAYNLMGAHVPVLGSEADDRSRKRKIGDLDVSVDVDTLERDDGLSKGELRKRYDETRQREGADPWRGKVDQDDLSNMINEEKSKRFRGNRDR